MCWCDTRNIMLSFKIILKNCLKKLKISFCHLKFSKKKKKVNGLPCSTENEQRLIEWVEFIFVDKLI